MIRQLGEGTTCTHQSLNVTWAKELFSTQGLFISILYPTVLKVPPPSNSFKNVVIKYFTLTFMF